MATDSQDGIDAEFAAMQTVFSTLKGLDDDEARRRVLEYVGARFDIRVGSAPKQKRNEEQAGGTDDEDKGDVAPASYGSFAELHDAAQPKTNPEKALVAGYWLQVCEGAGSFDSQSANTLLKHLGEGMPNITSALDSLKSQKPALALQLKKSGKTRQARKTFKITTAGMKQVEAMIRG